MKRQFRMFGRANLVSTVILILFAPSTGEAREPAGDATTLDACLEQQAPPRIARVIDPAGQVVYARVLEQRDGQPTRVAPIAAASAPLAAVFERAASVGGPAFDIPAAERAARVCAAFDLPQAALDAHERVLVAAGLNYAAHAEESGGGDVFLFPKPAEPTGPYAALEPPAHVVLLDYEVELGFVLLEAIDPLAPLAGADLLAATAFFLANDISDREPIVRYKAFTGPGTGFVDAKGQPGFLPAGPWLVRGSDLFAALAACGGVGLGLQLWVDEGEGPQLRQSATTAAMILDPHELLVRLGAEIQQNGRFTSMPFRRDTGELFYPLAVGDAAPRLPPGSAVLTGTPEGVVIGQVEASPLGLVLRGALHGRGPFEQFVAEEKERVKAGERGGYLKRGDRVRARIDGLGAQEFSIGGQDGALSAPAACRAAEAPSANAKEGGV